MPRFTLLVLIAALLAGSCTEQPPPKGLPVLPRKYLGQTLPSDKPLMFARGVISTGMYERDFSITGNGNEIYYTLYTGDWVTIMAVKRIGGTWYQPAVAEFARDSSRYFAEPSVSIDGSRIFFLSAKPGWIEQDIWMAKRTANGGWGRPEKLPPPVNTGKQEFYPSLARNGNLYFTRRDPETGISQILVSKPDGNRFTDPIPLPESVNGTGSLYNAAIAPDEQFLVTCMAQKDSVTRELHSTYMIYFHNPDGSWSKGIDLVKTLRLPCSNAISISVSADGNYLFYSSANRTQFYKDLAPGWKSSSLHRQRNLPGNGNSDIYWFDFKKILFRL